MNNLPALAITVVSYDSSPFLDECLSTLLNNIEADRLEAGVVVAENGDEAAAKRTLAKIKPYLDRGIIWKPAPENLGYGGGANYGWDGQDGEIFLVLNPDMSFPPGWLKALVKPFGEKPEIGIVGCKLLDGQGKVQHAGGLVRHGSLLGEHFGAGEENDGRWDESCEVEFVTGAALAIRHEVREQLKGFDPAFFPGYYEDVDLCRRAREVGWKVWYEAGAVANHFEGGSFGRSDRYFEAFHRNRLRFAQKSLSTHRFFNEYLPAERRRLQLTPPGKDLSASRKVYRQVARKYSFNKFSKKGDNMQNDENPIAQRLPGHMAEVKKGWLVEEKPFRSSLPFIASLRERFNSISTRWYVKPILQQQVDYNASVARTLEDLGQLTLAEQASHDLEFATLAERFNRLEDRLTRIETMLEQIMKVNQNA